MARLALIVGLVAATTLPLAGCSKDAPPTAGKDVSRGTTTAARPQAPAVDWSKVREWTADQRAGFVEVAREQSEVLRVRADELKKRAAGAAANPAVQQALADLDEARSQYRTELFRLGEQVKQDTAEAFQATRQRVLQLRFQVYEATERLQKALESGVE
jgi:hypothetical protein